MKCPFCDNQLNSFNVCKEHGTIAQPDEVPEDLDVQDDDENEDVE